MDPVGMSPPAGHHAQNGTQSDPRSPVRGSEGVQIPSTLQGTAPQQDPRPLEGTPGTCQIIFLKRFLVFPILLFSFLCINH